MKEATRNFAGPLRWSLFVLALPLSGFISLIGWVGTGFGGITDSLPLLLVLPVHLIGFFSLRIAASGLFSLLVIHLLLPLRFGINHITLENLAPSRIDPLFWLLVIMVGAAAFAFPICNRAGQIELS